MPLDQAQFLDLIARNFPPSWLDGLENPGPGYEIIEMFAAIGERLDEAVDNLRQSLYVYLAPSGARATVTLSLTRSTTVNEVIVEEGSSFKDSVGRVYATLAPITFSIGDDGPHEVTAQAVVPGYDYNQIGPYTTSGGEDVPGDISRRNYLVLTPPFGDTTIVASQVGEATGGVAGMLDLHAESLGSPRMLGESDTALRTRLRQTVRTTTPAAILLYLESVFTPLGLKAYLIEPFEQGCLGVYDAPPGGLGEYPANLLAYDDFRVPGGTPSPPGNGVFWGRWFSSSEVRAAYVVVVPRLPAMLSTEFFLDDVVDSMDALDNPLGQRALSMLDLPSTLIASTQASVLDGSDEAAAGVYRGLLAGLRRISGAGIAPLIELYEGT